MADSEVAQEITKEEISISTSSEQKQEQETSVTAPKEKTVTSVTEKLTVTKKEEKPKAPPPAPPKPTAEQPAAEPPAAKPPAAEPQMASSAETVSARTMTSTKSVREYTDTSHLLSDLSRDYRGTSPAVLESIATHPALYSTRYRVDKMRPHLSARSRKVIRDAEDLAHVQPGLKNMLEVQYQYFCLSVLSAAWLLCVPNCRLLS